MECLSLIDKRIELSLRETHLKIKKNIDKLADFVISMKFEEINNLNTCFCMKKKMKKIEIGTSWNARQR